MITARSALWASIYSGIGGLVLSLSAALWGDGCARLGLSIAIQTPVLEAALFGVLEVCAMVPTMTIIISYLMAKNRQLYVVAIVAASLTLVGYYLTALATLASKYQIGVAALGSYWALIFGFLNGGIVGCSLYLHITLQKRSEMRINDEHLGIEALKLEHNWSLTAFTSLSYATMIFVVSAVLVSWTQMTLPQITPERIQTLGAFELFTTTVVQLVYIGIGLWLGIVGKLLGYSLSIHKRMLELKEEVNRNGAN